MSKNKDAKRKAKQKAKLAAKRPTVKVTARKKKSLKLSWKKDKTVTGYQIQYSTSRTFASGNKAVGVAGAATVSRVIGSLTKGKTYYVRIRTYKTVGKTKYYSTWSAAKTVTTK